MIYLREPLLEDAAVFHRCANDLVTKKYDQAAGAGRESVEDVIEEIRPWTRTGYATNMRAELLAVEDLTGRTIGRAEITYFLNGDAELAFFLTPEARGFGFGSDLVSELCSRARAHGSARCTALVHPDNQASRRSLHRNGFVGHGPMDHHDHRWFYTRDL